MTASTGWNIQVANGTLMIAEYACNSVAEGIAKLNRLKLKRGQVAHLMDGEAEVLDMRFG